LNVAERDALLDAVSSEMLTTGMGPDGALDERGKLLDDLITVVLNAGADRYE
jgi:hypothetical protein